MQVFCSWMNQRQVWIRSQLIISWKLWPNWRGTTGLSCCPYISQGKEGWQGCWDYVHFLEILVVPGKSFWGKFKKKVLPCVSQYCCCSFLLSFRSFLPVRCEADDHKLLWNSSWSECILLSLMGIKTRCVMFLWNGPLFFLSMGSIAIATGLKMLTFNASNLPFPKAVHGDTTVPSFS